MCLFHVHVFSIFSLSRLSRLRVACCWCSREGTTQGRCLAASLHVSRACSQRRLWIGALETIRLLLLLLMMIRRELSQPRHHQCLHPHLHLHLHLHLRQCYWPQRSNTSKRLIGQLALSNLIKFVYIICICVQHIESNQFKC